MIATYIQELLAVNNRVIIPNYGAFLVRATSKSKDAETLKEKLKDVYFSPFLKFNDELLEKYIITKEGITKEQASEKISLFIDDIKKVLDQEKPYEIKDFGKFTSDKQGKVQFISFAKEGVEVSVENKKPETKTSLKTQETTKDPVADKETKKTEVTEEPKTEVKEKLKLEELKTEKTEPEKSPGENKEMNQPQTKVSQTKPTYSYKKEKKPINKSLILSIAIGLPLAAVFIWAILNFSTIKKIVTKDKSKTEQLAKKKPKITTKKAATDKKDPANNEAVTKEGTKQVEQKAIEQKPITPVKKYYIIAGSFKNEEYAASYLDKLKKEGYKAEKLDKRNGMYAVSFNSFTDKRKAIAEYKFLSKEKGLQAWILYY